MKDIKVITVGTQLPWLPTLCFAAPGPGTKLPATASLARKQDSLAAVSEISMSPVPLECARRDGPNMMSTGQAAEPV